MLTEITAAAFKGERYARLVGDRKTCSQCTGVVNPSACSLGAYDSAAHIGPWSDWQGNLNADIMVIGQEWGGTDNYERQLGRDRDGDPTNANLVTLMASIGLSLPTPTTMQGTSDNGDLFFTNGVLCLRKGAATNRIEGNSSAKSNALPKKVFGLCARTFLRPQIELVEPRFVLVLGLLAWNALMEAFSFPIRSTLKAALNHGPVSLSPTTIAFPLFHCGSKLHLNRPLQLQINDWKKVKEIMHKQSGTQTEGK